MTSENRPPDDNHSSPQHTNLPDSQLYRHVGDSNQTSSSSNPYDPIETDAYRDIVHRGDHRLGVSGIFCWCLILGFTAFMLLTTMKGSSSESEETNFFQNPSSVDMAQTTLQGKGVVAQENLQRMLASLEDHQDAGDEDAIHTEDQVDNDDGDEGNADGTIDRPRRVDRQMDNGTLVQRLCYIVLVNEIEGPDAALEAFQELQQRVEKNPRKMTDRQQQVSDTIEQLLQEYSDGDYQSGRTDEDTRQLLTKEMGWFGELFLAPAGANDDSARDSVMQSANLLFWGFAGVVLLGLAAMFFGFVLLIVVIALTTTNRIKMQLVGSRIPANIYLETFAIWLFLFMGFQFSMAVVIKALDYQSQVGSLYFSSIGFFGSLLALLWPLMRGVSFSDLLNDLGLRWKKAWLETIIAGFSYLSVLPALFVSVIFVGLLIGREAREEFTTQEGPSHPVQEFIADGNFSVFFAVLLLACVAAPIVEEIMFRGVLYRHLRNYSQTWARWASVLMACLVNSFIFAAIHPQGLAGIPMLMTLAIGFSLVREYRDSLTAPIVMHGISNFLVLNLSYFILK